LIRTIRTEVVLRGELRKADATIKSWSAPRLNETAVLTSQAFLAVLELPRLGDSSGARGLHCWFPGQTLESLDAVEPFAEILKPIGEPLSNDDAYGELKARRRDALAKIHAEYDNAAGQILRLLTAEASVVVEIEQWRAVEARRVVVGALPPIAFPAARIGDGRPNCLARAISLPRPFGEPPHWVAGSDLANLTRAA